MIYYNFLQIFFSKNHIYPIISNLTFLHNKRFYFTRCHNFFTLLPIAIHNPCNIKLPIYHQFISSIFWSISIFYIFFADYNIFLAYKIFT